MYILCMDFSFLFVYKNGTNSNVVSPPLATVIEEQRGLLESRKHYWDQATQQTEHK